MAKRRVPAGRNIGEVSATVAQLKATFQEIIKEVDKLKNQGKSAKEIYDSQLKTVEDQLAVLKKTSDELKVIKKETSANLNKAGLESKTREDLTKALNKAVGLEKQLGAVKKDVQNAVISSFQEEQAVYREKVKLGDKELDQIKEKLDKGRLAGAATKTEARLKQESLEITKREKNEQQQLRDQIKEGNARRTEDVKAFESRRADFARRRKARLKEIGQLEKKQEQDRVAAAKTQLEIDLKMLNRGKMSLEQRREAQAKLIRGFRANYDQQSNDYKRLTLRLIKLDESFEKQIADRDRKREKGSKDYAKNEAQRQKQLNTARRKVFKAEIDLAKITAEKKIDAVNKYYNSELRNLEVLGKKNTKEYKDLYAEQLRLLKKYYRQKEAEDKKATKESTGPSQKRKGFLGGLREGFKGSEIGKAVGRLTGIGSVVAVLRKSFQLLSKAITGSFKAAVNFEAQLAQLQAVTGVSNKELDKLSKSVLDVAGSTTFTSEQIVELQTELGKLGFSSDEIIAATKGIAATAQALGENVGPVAQKVGQILKQYNLSAAETEKVSDTLVSTINSSALSFESFSTALQYIGPLAAEVGTTFQETSAAMAILADNGFTASRIGTGLRGILTELSSTGEDLSSVIEELADRNLSFAEAIDLVGKRNAAQLITLVDNVDALTDAESKYYDTGSAAIASAIQIDTYKGNLQLLNSALNKVSIAFGNLIKNSKILQLALRLVDEEGFKASKAAESLSKVDPKDFSEGIVKGAETVINELTHTMNMYEAQTGSTTEAFIQATAARRIKIEEQANALADKLLNDRYDKELLRENKRLEQRKQYLIEVYGEVIGTQMINEDRLYQKINDNIVNIKSARDSDRTAEREQITELIKQTVEQKNLDNARLEISQEFNDDLEKRRKIRKKDFDDLGKANKFQRENEAKIEDLRERVAKQKEVLQRGDIQANKELLGIEKAKLEQLEQEQQNYVNLLFTKQELEQFAQKEFELEFKSLANGIELRKQQLEEEQALLEVQIKTQQNLAKNAATEKERTAASQKLAELQIKRAENEKTAFIELTRLTEEYDKIIKKIGKDIKEAGLDGRFIEKAEERLESFKLSFADLDINITDLAKAVGILSVSLGKTFKDKLSKGLELDASDKGKIYESLTKLITSLIPNIEEGSDEFNELYAKLNELLMSNLIPDPDSEVVEKRKKLLEKILSKLSDAIKDYNQTALQNTQSRLDRELESIRNRYKVEGDIIKSQLDNQLITESQFRSKQKELRLKQIAEENDIQKKKFDAQKRSDIINVGVDTAEALAANIVKNFKSFDTITATGLTAAGNLVILGAGAARADAIRRRKFFPAKFEQGGMVEGPSHAEGGVPFTVQGRSGYEMEGGEFIVNKKAASLHRGLLEKINNSYKVPTASSNYKFAQGGLVKAQANESVDYLKAIAEATTSTAIQGSKPVRAFISSKDLRSNETERRLRDRNDRI